MDNMVKIGSKVAVDGVIGLLSNIKLDGINVHSVTVEVEWDSNVDRAAKNLSYDNETNELTITQPKCIWAITTNEANALKEC
tara:strand:+ start:108 stop:353 length:246 start_codon:yes stop_codon:yes gene_type:complete